MLLGVLLFSSCVDLNDIYNDNMNQDELIVEIFGNDFREQLELQRSFCAYTNTYNATINITVIVPREDPGGSGVPVPTTFFEDSFENVILPANNSVNNGLELTIMVPETGHYSLIIEV